MQEHIHDREGLTAQVKRNCDISDAHYWDSYSLCGLLLRLRELYRSESGIKLWMHIPHKSIGDWIDKREALWHQLRGTDLQNIEIGGQGFGPFQIREINSLLHGQKLLYGAGYGITMKPSFFLADLVSREQIDGIEVYIAGTEYARDLSDYPAVLQGEVIITRLETIKMLIWQKLEELQCKSAKAGLAYAFSEYGIPEHTGFSEDTYKKLDLIARAEAQTYIRHEIGELVEDEKMGDEWKTLLTIIPHSKAEVFARSVKDILADTSERGMIRYIIDNRLTGSLGFYTVFLSGFRKTLFPEMLDAFRIFTGNRDWNLVENARRTAYQRASYYADKILACYRREGQDTEKMTGCIDNEVLSRLG
jgi:hypothetical protein